MEVWSILVEMITPKVWEVSGDPVINAENLIVYCEESINSNWFIRKGKQASSFLVLNEASGAGISKHWEAVIDIFTDLLKN